MGGGKHWDYCYNPLHGGVKELGGGNDSKAKNLQRCVGECDADSQCAYGLKCFQRSKGEKIPGCKDGKNKMPDNFDYCYDPKTEVTFPKTNYVMEGFGKVCSGELTPLNSEADCKNYAKTYSRSFGSSSSHYTIYPKGCFFLNTKLYFNKGKTGRGNSKARPICLKAAGGNTGAKTTPKKPANPCLTNNGGCDKARKCMNSNGKAKCGNCPKGYTNLGATKCKKAAAPTTTKSSGKANFVLGSYNKLCSGGLTPVNSETDCRNYAKSIGRSFRLSSDKLSNYPKGCFLFLSKLYFNKGNTGRTNSQARPVCLKAAGGNTGAKTPPKKPANPCLTNNGGCDKARKCMNSNGKAKCGNCPKGYTN